MNKNPEAGGLPPEEIKKQPEQTGQEIQPPTQQPEKEKTETEIGKFEASFLENLRQATLKNFAPHPSLKERYDRERRPFVEGAKSVVPKLELNEDNDQDPHFYFALRYTDEEGQDVDFVPRTEKGNLDDNAIWGAFSEAAKNYPPELVEGFYKKCLNEALLPIKQRVSLLESQVSDFEQKFQRTKNQWNKDDLQRKRKNAKDKLDRLNIKLTAARLKYREQKPFEVKKPHEEADQEVLLKTLKELPPQVSVAQALERSEEATIKPDEIEVIPPPKKVPESKQEKSAVVIEVLPEKSGEETIITKRSPEEINKEIATEEKRFIDNFNEGSLSLEKVRETMMKLAALHREKGDIELAENLEKEAAELNEETYAKAIELLKQEKNELPPPEKPPLTYPESGGNNNEGWWNRVPPKVKKYVKVGVIAGGIGAGIGIGLSATSGIGVGLGTGLALGVGGTVGIGALPFIIWYLLKGWGKLFNWSWEKITGDKFYEGKKKE
ncbi:hypothetical protein C4553_02440 [Candidatus Parcubacteria bacterium]|nr:MAG: hypothetical protein C4553_02440 [Candidatus Parcubacteria bacterium]